jgi:hypothetical protein
MSSSSRAASPRVLTLAAVVATRAGALLVLLAETRTRAARSETQTSALLVMLLEPRERAAPAAATVAARPRVSRPGPPPATEPAAAAPAIPTSPGATID